jgi:hypothetical protein
MDLNSFLNLLRSDILFPFLFLLLPLLCGIALALGHHLFFSHLSGRPVPDTIFINSTTIQLSKQQVNLVIGNAFAFGVKFCLSTAVGMAYVQLFLTSLFAKPQRVSAVDTMFSGLSDLCSFLRGTVWLRNPLLFVLALTVWYVWPSVTRGS